MESRTQNGVDHDIGLRDKVRQLIARGSNDDVHIAPGSSTSNVSSERRGDLVRLDGTHHIDLDTLMLQDIRCDPTVAAVVSKANEYRRTLGLRRRDHGGREFAGMLHERRLGRSRLLDAVFQLGYFFTAENRSHLNPHDRSTFHRKVRLIHHLGHVRARQGLIGRP